MRQIIVVYKKSKLFTDCLVPIATIEHNGYLRGNLRCFARQHGGDAARIYDYYDFKEEVEHRVSFV